jgi:hypothetical protein
LHPTLINVAKMPKTLLLLAMGFLFVYLDLISDTIVFSEIKR